MSEKFNPQEYMTYIKDKPYLKPAHRILWFKLENGHDGSITTELVQIDPFPIVKAYVHLNSVVIASAYGTAQVKQGTVYFGREVEKAETAAIGRALSYAGYGTQFSEDDEDENLADSPIGKSRQNRATSPAVASNGNGQASHSQVAETTQNDGNSGISKTPPQLEAESASLAENMPIDFSKNPPPNNAHDGTQWQLWLKRQYTIYKKVRAS